MNFEDIQQKVLDALHDELGAQTEALALALDVAFADAFGISPGDWIAAEAQAFLRHD